MSEENKVLGWHFINKDRKLAYRDNRVVRTGRLYKVSNMIPLKLCRYGLHASEKLIWALLFADYPILCRVELIGKIVKDYIKMAAYQRRVLWIKNVKNELEIAARMFASDVAYLWKAPDVVKEFLLTGKEEFRVAARNAAYAARSWEMDPHVERATTAVITATRREDSMCICDMAKTAAWASREAVARKAVLNPYARLKTVPDQMLNRQNDILLDLINKHDTLQKR